MKSAVLAAVVLAFGSSVAAADPVADRQSLMKELSRAARAVAPFARGQADYDAPTVQAALETLQQKAAGLDIETLFPAGTESGGGTEAAPSVWDDRAGFGAAAARFKTDIAAAVDARPQDQAALEPLFGAVSGNCSACHRDYRL